MVRKNKKAPKTLRREKIMHISREGVSHVEVLRAFHPFQDFFSFTLEDVAFPSCPHSSLAGSFIKEN